MQSWYTAVTSPLMPLHLGRPTPAPILAARIPGDRVIP